MMSRTWIAVTVFWLTLGGTTGPMAAQQPQGSDRPLPNFDIRDRDLPAPSSAADRQNTAPGQSAAPGQRRSRGNPHTGALRVVDVTDLAIARELPPEGSHRAHARGRTPGLDAPDSGIPHTTPRLHERVEQCSPRRVRSNRRRNPCARCGDSGSSGWRGSSRSHHVERSAWTEPPQCASDICGTSRGRRGRQRQAFSRVLARPRRSSSSDRAVRPGPLQERPRRHACMVSDERCASARMAGGHRARRRPAALRRRRGCRVR